MKKFLSVLALTLLAQSFVQAQMKQGSILLGGDINFSSNKTENPASPNTPDLKTNGFSFSPSAALALHDNFYLGIRLNYGHSSIDNPNDGSGATNQKTDQFGGGVFLREYKPLGAHFYFFVEENLGAIGSKNTLSYFNAPQLINKTISLNLSIYPGVSYAVTPHFQLETGLQNFFSINYQRTKYDAGDKQSQFSAGTAFNQFFDNLYLGARFLFGH